MKLKDRKALVTGGSRGIGKACALKLASDGAHVIVNFQTNQAAAEKVVEEILAKGGSAEILGFDISKTKETQEKLEQYVKAKGPITILVNNAGITRDGLLARYSEADWDLVMATNLKGAFNVSQALLRGMMKERKGSIIHMSSVVGVVGNPGQAAYCAAKAGLIGLTKSMAKELASREIRVNAVAPGFIQTDMTHQLTPDQKEAMLKHIPLGREGTAEEIAHAVAFLASDDSRYITGQVLQVDGGMGM